VLGLPRFADDRFNETTRTLGLTFDREELLASRRAEDGPASSSHILHDVCKHSRSLDECLGVGQR
jgi:hypothetical protein